MNWGGGGSIDVPVWIRGLIAYCRPSLSSNKNVVSKEAEQEWNVCL